MLLHDRKDQHDRDNRHDAGRHNDIENIASLPAMESRKDRNTYRKHAHVVVVGHDQRPEIRVPGRDEDQHAHGDDRRHRHREQQPVKNGEPTGSIHACRFQHVVVNRFERLPEQEYRIGGRPVRYDKRPEGVQPIELGHHDVHGNENHLLRHDQRGKH